MAENISEIRKKWFIEQADRLKASGTSYAEIASALGVLPQYLNGIINGDRGASEKFVNKFCERFNINHNDLLNRYRTYSVSENEVPVVSQPEHSTYNGDGLPLIPIEAIAGYGKGDITVMDSEIKERYLVPEFSVRGVKFLIRVSGSSMYPKYSNGDVLACEPITDTSFFQWGKVYVLDTDQGALVKRLYEGKNDDCIECRSDNKEHYPAFQILKTSIRSISIVVGVIRIE